MALQGTMSTGDGGKARPVGLMMQLVVMSALVLGSIHALLFVWLDAGSTNTWWTGALIALPHGLVAAVAMASGQAPVHARWCDGPKPVRSGRGAQARRTLRHELRGRHAAPGRHGARRLRVGPGRSAH